ncbi:MAG: CopG family transcriptional regulator [Betaproteobacteria bacterium]|nr:CopG family transcriptional regulator [Betaproteobacteria bacterium]
MKNVTVTLDDAVLEWVRVKAARDNTSVSRLLGELLQEQRQREDAYERAMNSWLARKRTWASQGKRYPRRDSLYAR